jgi:hypothetical protein
VGAPEDLVAAAVAELYACDPQDFTDRRKAIAAEAKAAGDAAAARQIAALRKPTRAAWVVNRLARADPAAPDKLTALATALRAAEQAKDGPRLRELSAARGPLIDALTGQALAVAGVPDPPAGLRDEVAATLTAAFADPEVAASFAAGTLTRAAQWSGFGLALSGPGPDAGDGDGDGDAALAAALQAAPAPVRPRGGARQVAAPAATGARPAAPVAPAAGRSAAPEQTQDQRQLAETRRLEERERKRRLAEEAAAEEAAQAAARRRKAFDDAERAAASATAAASDAVAAEDRLEAEVHSLEDRLTQARAELADARLRARRAEIAERKARQALDRLLPPDDDATGG